MGAGILRKAGLAKVANLAGGMVRWRDLSRAR
jgi:rhodanese-related sulfurtransferase